MQKYLLILLLIILGLGYVRAQNGLELWGTVKDSSGGGISKATIRLITDTDTSSVLSGEDGSFNFRLSRNGAFRLLITMSGYESVEKKFPGSKEGKSLVLPSVVLKPAYGDLTPVTVLHIKPVTIKEDTTEYNARAFNVRAGDELEKLLKKLPGLLVTMDGSVMIGGKKISRILVNGRAFPGDLMMALQNLPVDIIDKVQVIDDYGDKARLTGVKSGESEKVLNVILKQDKRNGQIGQVVAGVGDNGKYNATLFSDVMKDDRQITLNAWLRNTSPTADLNEKGFYVGYSDLWNKKWSTNTSLSISGDNHSSGSSLIQDNFFPGSKIHQEQSTWNSGNRSTFASGYTLIYTPRSGSTLRINPSYSDSKSDEAVLSQFSTNEQDSNFIKTTVGSSNNITHSHTQSAGSDIYFEKLYSGSGKRFSFAGGVHYTRIKQENDQLINTQVQINSLSNYSRQHYLLTNGDYKREVSISLNYYSPLGKAGFLELGYSLRYSYTQNGKITQSLDSTETHPMAIDSLSNDYYFQVMYHRIHTGYSTHLKRLNLTLSLDAQPSVQSGQTVGKDAVSEYHYFPILPLVQLAYTFCPTGKLNFEYSGNSTAPTLQQLQPVTDLSNPLYPITGNPNLKASYTHVAGLHYEQSSLQSTPVPGFGLELRYATTQNMVISKIVHPSDTSSVIQRTSFENADGFHSIVGNYHIDLPRFFSKRLRLTLGGGISNMQTVNLLDNIMYNTSTIAWNQGLTFNLDIPEIMESELNGNYSHSLSRYSGSSSSFSSASWTLHNRHFFNKWIVDYALNQLFSSDGIGIKANPALLNASLQKQFFSNNRLTVNFSAYNVLNINAGVNPVITPTSVTQNRSSLIGRYFLLTAQFKLQHFR